MTTLDQDYLYTSRLSSRPSMQPPTAGLPNAARSRHSAVQRGRLGKDVTIISRLGTGQFGSVSAVAVSPSVEITPPPSAPATHALKLTSRYGERESLSEIATWACLPSNPCLLPLLGYWSEGASLAAMTHIAHTETLAAGLDGVARLIDTPESVRKDIAARCPLSPALPLIRARPPPPPAALVAGLTGTLTAFTTPRETPRQTPSQTPVDGRPSLAWLGAPLKSPPLAAALAAAAAPAPATSATLPPRMMASTDDVLTICADVCTALHALHCRGITHRDVRAQNILLRPLAAAPAAPAGRAGRAGLWRLYVAVLGDYGLASLPGATTGAEGDGRYLPLHEPTGTKECDMWALGGLVWEAATGLALPTRETRGSIGGGMDGVDEVVKEIVSGLLESDPKKRLTASQLIRHPAISSRVIQQPSCISTIFGACLASSSRLMVRLLAPPSPPLAPKRSSGPVLASKTGHAPKEQGKVETGGGAGVGGLEDDLVDFTFNRLVTNNDGPLSPHPNLNLGDEDDEDDVFGGDLLDLPISKFSDHLRLSDSPPPLAIDGIVDFNNTLSPLSSAPNSPHTSFALSLTSALNRTGGSRSGAGFCPDESYEEQSFVVEEPLHSHRDRVERLDQPVHGHNNGHNQGLNLIVDDNELTFGDLHCDHDDEVAFINDRVNGSLTPLPPPDASQEPAPPAPLPASALLTSRLTLAAAAAAGVLCAPAAVLPVSTGFVAVVCILRSHLVAASRLSCGAVSVMVPAMANLLVIMGAWMVVAALCGTVCGIFRPYGTLLGCFGLYLVDNRLQKIYTKLSSLYDVIVVQN